MPLIIAQGSFIMNSTKRKTLLFFIFKQVWVGDLWDVDDGLWSQEHTVDVFLLKRLTSCQLKISTEKSQSKHVIKCMQDCRYTYASWA